jgi:hypothetical protein
MPKYEVSLTKTIVIEVDAASFDEARDAASMAPEYLIDPDGSWQSAEPQIDVLGPKD